jgi:ABC-type Mn2+/Zn2+ transport system permease subunit
VAGIFSRVLWKMMIFSSLLCMAFTSFGLGFSYVYNIPAGSNIILVAGSVYILSVMGRFLLRRRRA